MRAEPATRLLHGAATGVAFGTLLQRGRASSYDLIMNQLRLNDGAIAKIMGTAVATGAVGVHWLNQRGQAKLDVKPLQLGGVIGGGLLFGSGLALLGYCPGTSLAALGEGKRDAAAGVLGMLAGAAIFVRTYPAIKPLLEAGDSGKVTLAAPGKSPWPWVAALAGLVALSCLNDIRPKRRSILSRLWPRS